MFFFFSFFWFRVVEANSSRWTGGFSCLLIDFGEFFFGPVKTTKLPLRMMNTSYHVRKGYRPESTWIVGGLYVPLTKYAVSLVAFSSSQGVGLGGGQCNRMDLCFFRSRLLDAGTAKRVFMLACEDDKAPSADQQWDEERLSSGINMKRQRFRQQHRPAVCGVIVVVERFA